MRDSVNLKLSKLVKDLIELTVQRGEALLLLAGLNRVVPGFERQQLVTYISAAMIATRSNPMTLPVERMSRMC